MPWPRWARWRHERAGSEPCQDEAALRRFRRPTAQSVQRHAALSGGIAIGSAGCGYLRLSAILVRPAAGQRLADPQRLTIALHPDSSKRGTLMKIVVFGPAKRTGVLHQNNFVD